ncbi:MAG: FAD-dependent monooxygenase [Anaerolineae bacterium]|nr:FAD-dependent monooxygenase [Anaerolineae bacterium]
MTPLKRPLGQRAVVIGGSMAGLLAARVLSDRYAEVVLIERDGLPASAQPRKGVPQGQHAHALLARGREILEELFPGLTEHLVSRGAPRGRGRFFSGGGYFCPIPNGPQSLFVSRPCLEAEVRARLAALPYVHIFENCDAVGLAASEDRSRVTGVRLTRRQAGNAEELLPADLVVDASGRGSRTPAWLESLGYTPPQVEWVEVKMGYATRFYRRQPEHLDGDLMVNVAPTPDNKRACGMLAQEGERWIVTLAGYFGDYPPTDEPGFLEFARSLPVPDVYELIRTATPLSDPVPFKFPANQRRRYEKLARLPEGLLVIGDALCSFTPIYGQGMSVAAAEALLLRDCLAGGTGQLARRYFKQAGKIVDIAWSIAAGNDLSLSGAKADLTPPLRFLRWYIGKLQIAARHDPVVALAFMKVANLLAPPPSLLQPGLALRVLGGNLRSVRAEASTADKTATAWLRG